MNRASVSKIIRLLLFAAAIVLILIGIHGGEPKQVLLKAVNICLECIGVG